MKLATVQTDDGSRAAVVTSEGVVPVEGYEDVGALLSDRADGWARAREAESGGAARPTAEVEFRRPLLAPQAVVCVGLNYRNHILEMGRELPDHPTLFSKLPRALVDPYQRIDLPAISEKWDYEAELVIVIGEGGRDIREDQALDRVAGFTIMNDVTARDLQWRTAQWFAGKTVQDSTPLGPWIVTPDETGDLAELEISLSVNGEERQRARLGELVFDVPRLVADLSRIVELRPGDVIATGTPGGVGEPDGLFIQNGDVIEVSIDRIGTIRNQFTRESN
jgi:acylpyruvate hydrolase